jgi:hypothetical protein
MTEHRMRFLKMFVLLSGVLAGGECGFAQHPTASGSLVVQLQNGSGLQMVFQTDPSGVVLGNAGTAAATLGFGSISAYGTAGSGITKINGSTTFTVSTLFDINVQQSGLTSTSYTLSASLSGAAPTGITYQIDSVALSTSSQSIQTNGVYGNNISHTFNAIVSTAASGSGGPTTGTQLTSTINFTATAN